MKKIIIILGVVGTSLSAVLVRFADAPSTVLVFYRMLFSVLLLAPVVLTRCKGEYRSMEKKHLFLCMASGLFLGIHFVCYFEALNRTSIAACVSLVDTEVFFCGFGRHPVFAGKIVRQGLAVYRADLCGKRGDCGGGCVRRRTFGRSDRGGGRSQLLHLYVDWQKASHGDDH